MGYIRQKSSFFLIFIIAILILSSCPVRSADQVLTTDTEDNQQESGSTSSDSEILFSIGENQKYLPGNNKSIQNFPNEIIYVNNIYNGSDIKTAPILKGENSIVLSKNSNSLIGFVYNPSLSASKNVIARDINSGIQSIGNLNIVKAGLDSLPLSSNAADKIDLGILSVSENSIDSNISSETTLKAIGYAELDSYSMFDSAFLKLLNPDIDRNGKYDIEENKKWVISGIILHSFYPEDFNTSGPTLPISTFLEGDFSLLVWLNKTFEHPDYKSVFLRLPPENVYIKKGGDVVSGVYAHWHGLNGGPGGEYNEYYFDYFKRMLESPKAPFNGDYELVLGDKTYYFSNLIFPKPTETKYDGFLFPQTTLVFDNEGFLQKASYEWWIVRNNRYERPSEEEVKLIVNQFIIVGKQPKDFNKLYYESNELDFRKYKIKKTDIIGRDSDAGSYRCDYWDWAGNLYNFWYFIEGTRP